jgi:hypothetical protein
MTQDVKAAFERNPEFKELYMTSDGQLFANHGNARYHGRTLADSSVQTFMRESAESVSEAKTEAPAAEAIEAPAAEAIEAPAAEAAKAPAKIKTTPKKP